MIKELKEGLVKMDWREIIIKREDRKKPQTRIAGGNPNEKPMKGRRRGTIMDMEEDRTERQELANATREDLMDKVMDVIGSYSDEQLMELLLGTQGDIEVGSIQVKDNR
tara:strand:+ start:626 stop:952 length:327 start_codon:yes stop_codon:yes gene_type:complete